MSPAKKARGPRTPAATRRAVTKPLGDRCLILGGCGYLGVHLTKHLVKRQLFREVVIADTKAPPEGLGPGIRFLFCDVRMPIEDQIALQSFDWMFNFAAVHREPGHAPAEYFDTNIAGARNACAYADLIQCKNLFFSSSIAVYGKISAPVDERSPTYPDTPYGISKLYAEQTHIHWASTAPDRRLIIIRPGVIYGPGDPGNIMRMIKAIQKGIFVMPLNRDPRKSYGYIFGLLDSMVFMMRLPEKVLIYNYVEKETEPLSALVRHVKSVLGIYRPTLSIPFSVLEQAAKPFEFLPFWKGNINATRVRKITRSTHVVPARLVELDFDFAFDFEKSLRHWMSISPGDFA